MDVREPPASVVSEPGQSVAAAIIGPSTTAAMLSDARGCPPPAYRDFNGSGITGQRQAVAGLGSAAAAAAAASATVDAMPGSSDGAVCAASAAAELPPYEAAATPIKLPSYEESEKSKEQEAAGAGPASGGSFFLWRPSQLLFGRGRGAADEEMLGADGAAIGGPGGQRLTHAQLARLVVGTDIDFFCCFLIAFVFNWIGLVCTLCCLTATISGRAGAMAGFGLSVVKWALLVMHQSRFAQQKLGLLPTTMTDDGQTLSMDLEDNHYFVASCWLIVVLGFLCFLQGVVHYFKAKRCARDYQWLRSRYWGVPAAAVY